MEDSVFMDCPCCEGGYDIIEGAGENFIDSVAVAAAVKMGNNLSIEVYDMNGNTVAAAFAPIRFCPICGKELGSFC